jgi:hypothetical protein
VSRHQNTRSLSKLKDEWHLGNSHGLIPGFGICKTSLYVLKGFLKISVLYYSFLPAASRETNDKTRSDSRVLSNQVFVALKHLFNYDSQLVIFEVLSKVILEFGRSLREKFFRIHLLRNKDLLRNNFLF